MARPRVFVSSTYYDLKHIRSSLELFIESLGFEPILSEKGDIAYLPDVALDESCYREAQSSDIFVLVVGGRYGSEVSASASEKTKKAFFDRYESITRKEFETAHESDIPVFVLIESSVHAEYQTYLKNRDNKGIEYAHVDSINIFRLIEFILSQPRNNPIFNFERSSQIENWLRDQWAGLFREMLKSRSQQKQLLALTTQVGELKVVNDTLKNYLEEVLKGVSTDPTKVIADEQRRLKEATDNERVSTNAFVSFVHNSGKIPTDTVVRIIKDSSSFNDIVDMLSEVVADDILIRSITRFLGPEGIARPDVDRARETLGLLPFNDEPTEQSAKSVDKPAPVLKKPIRRANSKK